MCLCLLAVACMSLGFEVKATGRGAAPATKIQDLSDRLPAKPSVKPGWTIPIEDLGFAQPGANYLGQRNVLASLDFAGEDRVLFTFRIPGLMRREAESAGEDQRTIRAVVLDVKSGAVLARSEWTVHDRERYLLAGGDARFLLRDMDSIYELDANLNRRPLLHFPGPVEWMGVSPGGELIVTDSIEAKQKAGDEDTGSGQDTVLRILHGDTGKVELVARVRTAVRPAVGASGTYGTLRGNGEQWVVVESQFGGAMRPVDEVTSACMPRLDLVSEKVVLATSCTGSGGYTLTALNTGGGTLWSAAETEHATWPQFVTSRGGLRFAREALYVSQPVNSFDPLTNSDIKGQWVRVFDTATGAVALETPVAPILDAGGNVALSPSGRRVAVLNGSAIQIFELPDAPPLPESTAARSTH